MEKQTEKQLQRERLKQAVNEFLSRGGVIKKIKVVQSEPDHNFAASTSDLTQFLDHQLADDMDYFTTMDQEKMVDA